ncbi:MAG: recombinase family protein [Peptostreptococcaceae bacterium]|nr:recombinase family protein [Peptostreptococcaceae bacterium]
MKQACMYLRLSKEDGEQSESNSISNQRQIIKSFAHANEIDVCYEYVDDGYSGANFNRPDFKKMIRDLEDGLFSIIIVKDLSRFGRDYIESGKYLQKVFPEKNIRFISVNDNYDSENADVSDTHLILPIRNFINDSYCRDISMKVKSSKEVKRKNGQFIGAFAPFGYKKDVKDKHKLVVDTEVSHIVERIFQMKIDGYSSKAIADFLNSIGLTTPSRHKENSGENFSTGFVVKNSKWDSKTVNRVIQNKVYIGVLEQGKTTKLNYKSKKEVKVSKEDWIITENAHESIVSKSVFILANKMLLRDVKRSKEKPHLLSGMLYCKDCGSAMIRRTIKRKDSESVFYICSNHNNGGDCSRHSIKEEYVIDVMTKALNDYLEQFRELIQKASKLDIATLSISVDFESLYSEKKKYETLRQSLYMDLEDGLITMEEFERFRKSYLFKIKEIEKQIETKSNIEKELRATLSNESLLSSMLPQSEKEICRLSMVSFIDKILVGEDNELNFVFNDIETMNVLKALVKHDGEKQGKKPKSNSSTMIPISKLYAKTLPVMEAEPEYAIGGEL